MIDVLILSKTRMQTGKFCVGGITNKGRYVRLFDEHGDYPPHNTDYKPRQIWRFKAYEKQGTIAPHVEDILIHSKEFKRTLPERVKIKDFITERNIPIWRGSPDNLFDGLLQWTNSGSGYINKNNGIPAHSVGFWISDKDLTKKIFYEKPRYDYPDGYNWRSLPYVGDEEPVDVIPAGTLIRVSLAKWWCKDSSTEARCSLQLSGWYDLEDNFVVQRETIHSDEPDDLPF